MGWVLGWGEGWGEVGGSLGGHEARLLLLESAAQRGLCVWKFAGGGGGVVGGVEPLRWNTSFPGSSSRFLLKEGVVACEEKRLSGNYMRRKSDRD